MFARRQDIVHVGQDGWLFLTGGTNDVLAQYRRTLAIWWRLRLWDRLIRARTARAQSLGIRCLHAIVPEKLSIYDDRTDGLRYDAGRSPARRLAARLMDFPGFVDLVAPMRAERDGPHPLYRRTDSHWSYEGCLIAYRALMRACGAIPPADITERIRFTTDDVGDLGEKLPGRPHESVINWSIHRDAKRIFANPLVQAFEAARRERELHVGAHVVYRNDSAQADPRTVMLFGDSCAHFSPILLTGFLSESFRELHFVWSANIDWGHVARIGPDILIVEHAERFLARVPDDALDLDSVRRDLPPQTAPGAVTAAT